MGVKYTTGSFDCYRDTRFGPVAILWSFYHRQPKIWRILLSKPGQSARSTVRTLFPGLISSSCDKVDVVADQIAAFLTGEHVLFSLDVVRLDLCSDFQKDVLLSEHVIPRGNVSTYQRIAAHLRNPKASRAVGTALARNPFPVIVPCHRAIRSDRTLGGFQGGIGMKRALLEMEGILFNNLGRVVSNKFFY
jgi:methylated-DNA-[protein]-cysteine S-methyltransferase